MFGQVEGPRPVETVGNVTPGDGYAAWELPEETIDDIERALRDKREEKAWVEGRNALFTD